MNIPENIKQLAIKRIDGIGILLNDELKDGVKFFISGGETRLEEENDSRLSFIQSVEHLASLLLPYFDDRMQDYYSKNIIYLEGWHSEILELVKDEHFKKVYADAPRTSDDKNIKLKSDIMITLQIRKAKQMFNELNLFIQRNNILSDVIRMEDEKR